MASLHFTTNGRVCFSSPLRPPRALRRFISLRSPLLKVYALSSNDIKVGVNIEVDGAPWKVLEFLHVKPGKGAAFIRTKMKNYLTGNTVEKTFRAGSTLDEANIMKETKQYTYKDGDEFVFMDLTTFEEIRLNEQNVGDKRMFLKEGAECTLLFWNGNVIGFDLPVNVTLKVVEAEGDVKGDAKGTGSRPAKLETGVLINVPAFVKSGDNVVVDTRSGQYVSRA
ncbi:Elongation factor P [Carex littledalei]|uniref:Elongation factor P n=1 Tax=Carex littledalei TaxID=544730 RepID=A0A833QZL8_9POAL|nr:Elongation factor P [Carex littledalei]